MQELKQIPQKVPWGAAAQGFAGWRHSTSDYSPERPDFQLFPFCASVDLDQNQFPANATASPQASPCGTKLRLEHG